MSSSADPQLAVPSSTRRYRIEGEIARGGMGVVYRAWDYGRGRVLALKRAHAPGQATYGAAQKRCAELLEREYRTLLSLRHPRIIEVHDYGYDADGPYYTMELLEGSDLSAASPMPWRQACAILREVASSLALIHARGSIHRDVSPSNVRITPHGAKLFDFGTLAPFGLQTQVAGTPSCVAPEVLDHSPLDARVDLYALGATAYYALTGRVAYPARTLAQLKFLWSQQAPAPPSALVPDVPPALDELVMSLLALEPLSRPTSASEVIERLSAIADLPQDDDQLVVQSYLKHPAMVGREEPQGRLHGALTRMLDGQGGCVLIEAALGYGKSALLADFQREALLRGALVLSVNARARQDAQGTCHALLDQAALELGERGSASLRATQHSSESSIDQLARRMLSLTALRPIVLVVDDADQGDPDSLAVLTKLAHWAGKRELLLVLSAEEDSVRQPPGMRPLRRLATRVHLGPLGAEDVEHFVCGVFGSLPGTKRLARWLMQETHGSPLLCMDLLSELVEKGHVRYVGGLWVLPQELPARLVAGSANVFARRLGNLSPPAKELAAVLSARRIPTDAALCQELASGLLPSHAEQLSRLLTELLAARVLVGEGGQYAFSHRELQEAVYAQVEPAQRAQIHRAIANALAAAPGHSSVRNVEIGCHLMLAGDEPRGRARLASLLEVAPDLEALLRVLPDLQNVHRHQEERGDSQERKLQVTLPLLVAGVYVDPGVYDRLGESSLELLERRSGMKLAKRLVGWVGLNLALLFGIAAAYLRWLFAARRDRLMTFAYPLGYFAVAAQYSGQASFRMDRGAQASLLERFAVFAQLSRRLMPRLVADGVMAGAGFVSGRLAEAMERVRAIRAYLPQMRGLDANTIARWDQAYEFWEGRLNLARYGSEALVHADKLYASNVSSHWILGEFLRYAYHLGRGEAALAEQSRERLDTLTARFGSAWSVDLMTALEFAPHHLAGDLVGLKRCAEQLEALVALHPNVAVYLAVARAMQHGHRKRPEQAIAVYEQLEGQIDPFTSCIWSHAQAHWAECLNARGKHAAALARCQAALDAVGADADEFVGAYQQLVREKALALSGLGRHREATALLDELLARHGHQDQPLWVGLLHRDRARVAALAGDTDLFDVHAVEARARFRATNNPALIAQLRGLFDLGRARGMRVDTRASVDINLSAEWSLLKSVQDARMDQNARAHRAMEHVARISGAKRVRMYVVEEGRARLASQHGEDRWDPELLAQVEQAASAVSGDEKTAVIAGESADQASTQDSQELVTLFLDGAGGPKLVGLLLVADVARPGELTYERLEVLARILDPGVQLSTVQEL